jgi:hypothetical protein
MKELTKQQLINIILESVGDIDEMAKHENPISRPITDESGQIIGHDMRINPLDNDSPRVNVIFTCDIEDFMRTHPDLVQQLKEQYGNIKWANDVCPKYRPHQKQRDYNPLPGDESGDDIQRRAYQHSGEKMTATEKIKRDLNSLVEEHLGNEEVDKRLEKLSIPEIRARDRKHLDRYGRVDNDRIEYTTHTFNSYESSQQFLKFVTSRITGKEVPDEYKSYHLARQFNNNYQRWEETRKNDQVYQGKTPSYKLDKFGFDEANLDVTVRMDLKIVGLKMNEEYTWTITFKTKFGRKLKEERWIRNGLSLDKDVTIRKMVMLEPGKEFNDQYTVLDDLSIKTGLIEALDELQSKIMTEFKPVEALKLASAKQYDITKNLNEEFIGNLVDNIINEIKK